MKLSGELLFQSASMLSHNHVLTEVKNFFRKEFENVKNVFAFGLGLVGGAADVRYEVVPRNSPFLFHD